MTALQIALLTLLTAVLTRWLRQGIATESLRQWLQSRSSFLEKLINCPHCLSFWLALAATAVMWSWRAMSNLEIGMFILIGWRGAYYINRTLDNRATAAATPPAPCSQCAKPHDRGTFIERGSLTFCSMDCWFDYLRQRPISRDRLLGSGGEILRQEIYPMSYKDVTVAEAQQLLADDPAYQYVDVRSIPEFQAGHPKDAYCVPILHREAMGMVPNADFLTVMQVHFEQDTPLLIGCQSGIRSIRAAEALVAAGFTRVSNVLGGYGGAKDATGAVVAEGWFEQGLPVDYGDPEERSYAALHGGRGSTGGPA